MSPAPPSQACFVIIFVKFREQESVQTAPAQRHRSLWIIARTESPEPRENSDWHRSEQLILVTRLANDLPNTSPTYSNKRVAHAGRGTRQPSLRSEIKSGCHVNDPCHARMRESYDCGRLVFRRGQRRRALDTLFLLGGALLGNIIDTTVRRCC
jgi:hypothetical protein